MKPGDVSQHKKFIELSDAYNDLLNSDNKGNNKNRQDSQNDVFWKQPKGPNKGTQHRYNEK